jgi:hypothetical protein
MRILKLKKQDSKLQVLRKTPYSLMGTIMMNTNGKAFKVSRGKNLPFQQVLFLIDRKIEIEILHPVLGKCLFKEAFFNIF